LRREETKLLDGPEAKLMELEKGIFLTVEEQKQIEG